MEPEMDIFGEMEVLANRKRFEAEAPLSPSLEGLANQERERAGRLESARARLTKGGAEDEHLRALSVRSAAAGRLAEETSTLARRLGRRSVPTPDQWMVAGQVLNADGAPAANVRVRVYDRDRKFDDLLGETLTDDHGDFSVVYHERDFQEKGENLPELYVLVEDPAGRPLYSSRDKLRYDAGRAEFFEIVLPEPGRPTEG